MNTDDPIYYMKLHTSTTVFCGQFRWEVTRVPGGWIYTAIDHNSDAMNSVFVPYSEDFK